MSAEQIEQQLSIQATQLMRAAIMIARALAAREAASRSTELACGTPRRLVG